LKNLKCVWCILGMEIYICMQVKIYLWEHGRRACELREVFLCARVPPMKRRLCSSRDAFYILHFIWHQALKLRPDCLFALRISANSQPDKLWGGPSPPPEDANYIFYIFLPPERRWSRYFYMKCDWESLCFIPVLDRKRSSENLFFRKPNLNCSLNL
jgi:hypothetical protein